MKIALLSSSYHPYYKGGGEYSVKRLAEGLLSHNLEVFVITAYQEERQEDIDGVRVFRIKHPNIYWSFESMHKPAYQKLVWHMIEAYNPKVASPLLKILEREQPDILHIRNVEDFSPYACKVAKKLGIPVAVTLNSYTWLCPKATMFRNGSNCPQQCKDCKLITYPKKQLSKYVDVVVGVSQFMIDIHTSYQYFPNAQKEIVYTSSKVDILNLPIHQNAYTTFGYIGRLHPTKGVQQIIEAFIASSSVQSKLFIAGDGPEEYLTQCKKIAAGHENIIFLGKHDAKEFYKKVDVVIISSIWHEPFPRVLVEAYSFGRPVIASNTGGTQEMVINNKTGLVFDPQQNTQLVDCIVKFSQMNEELLQIMQENIAVFFQDNFKDENMRYISIYRSLLS
ncbi:glycosyltransferase involved in cell wall biosynthesis [Catalinimonas alkaloidigena]|uniref:glycosyltransferase family 4 protein n=1 Tax=Catalinimonas alkaloidigena TaxID=1075417 RepID=UPI002406F119|nr:glycosyltransferase family 4 protein [Catalinimonas alkaloidigena]MDF9801087.1 glycosyltransferase involved in cell wall biosynthesis [Catalinimonas alkaloidigena]